MAPRRRTVKKRLRRSLLIFLALLFMVEAWLWDKTGAAIAALLRHLPWERLRLQVERRILHLSPWMTLGVFIIPAMVLLPLKFIALWLIAHGFFLGGVSTVLLAKLAGLGVTSFLFTLCKPKLLQLRGIRWLYEWLLRLRNRAAALVRPYTAHIKRMTRRIRARFPRSKLLEKMRGRVHKTRRPTE